MESCCSQESDEVELKYETLFDKTDKILETITCWKSLEDEVLKLFCLFSRCRTRVIEGEEYINVNYVREKIFRLLIKTPLILDRSATRMFVTMKIEKDDFSEED